MVMTVPVKLARKVLESLPKNHSHNGIWREIISMAAKPILQVERCRLQEVLNNLIMPGLAVSLRDNEEDGIFYYVW